MTQDNGNFRFDVEPNGVATLTLNRPETLNSLTFRIYERLEKLFIDLQTDDSVKVVVITGEGRGFCSGANRQSFHHSPVRNRYGWDGSLSRQFC